MEPTHIAQPHTQALIVSHPDQYLEVFAAATVDVHIARVCAAHTRDGERLADKLLELMLPGRYRELYRADLLRAVSSTKPLKASVITDSLAIDKLLTELDKVAEELAEHPEEELVAWNL